MVVVSGSTSHVAADFSLNLALRKLFSLFSFLAGFLWSPLDSQKPAPRICTASNSGETGV